MRQSRSLRRGPSWRHAQPLVGAQRRHDHNAARSAAAGRVRIQKQNYLQWQEGAPPRTRQAAESESPSKTTFAFGAIVAHRSAAERKVPVTPLVAPSVRIRAPGSRDEHASARPFLTRTLDSGHHIHSVRWSRPRGNRFHAWQVSRACTSCKANSIPGPFCRI